MNFIQESTAFVTWFAQIVRAFFCLRPWTTLGVVCASVISKISRLLSFILPLKVILLAGSPGVPRYFPFIDPDEKMMWILGLSILAVASYALALGMETIVKRLSQDAGEEIQQDATQMAVLKNQEEAIQSYYANVCGLCANLLFIGVSLLLLLLLNPWLFLFLLSLMLGEYLFTAKALSGSETNPGKIKKYIQNKLSDYLKLLSSINFLSAFLVILYPFLLGGGSNILVALISIVLIRRLLEFVVDSVKDTVRLYRDRNKIDTLVFPAIQWQHTEAKEDLALRELFNKSAREQKAREELKSALSYTGEMEVQWSDSPHREIKTLTIILSDTVNQGKKHFQQQIFMPGSIWMENEDFLFRHIKRAHLLAPELITRFKQGQFQCQICEYGENKQVPVREWKNVYHDLLEHYLSCKPPEDLVQAYRASYKLMHERFNNQFVNRADVAVDTSEEEKVFERFQALLPEIQAKLANFPQYIYNPHVTRTNTVSDAQGGVYVMTWGRWSLRPLGTNLPRNMETERLIRIVNTIREARDDIPVWFRPQCMIFASVCFKLGVKIQKGFYKSALRDMRDMLEDPDIWG